MVSAHRDRRPVLRSRDALPFLACALVGFGVLALPPRDHHTTPLVLAVVLFAAIVGAALVLPWDDYPPWASAAPPLAYLVVVVLMREASGGTSSGLATLVALPVLWLSLHGDRATLAAAALGTGLVFAGPVLVLGEPDYPLSDLRRAVLWIAVASLVGPGIQVLVTRVRERETRISRVTTELVAIQRQWERFGEDLPDTVVLVVDSDLRYQQISGAGTLRDQIRQWKGQTLAETSSPANVEVLEPLYRAALAGQPGTCEITASTDGTPHRVTVVPYDLHGSPAVLVVARDVGLVRMREMAARRKADELRQLAEQDPLTGLMNRRTFDEVLVAHLADCVAAGGPRGAVLVLDIDHFKRVNDALGHRIGDRLIVSVSILLFNALRDADVVARLGGDEFAVLLREADDEVAQRVAERLVDVVQRHTSGVPEITGAVTASVGVRLIVDTTTSAHDLMVAADTAMYDAKRAGRDRFVVAPTDGT